MPLFASAQIDDSTYMANQGIVEDFFRFGSSDADYDLRLLHTQKLNLNTASYAELLKTGLFTRSSAKRLQNYIKQYGYLSGWAELKNADSIVSEAQVRRLQNNPEIGLFLPESNRTIMMALARYRYSTSGAGIPYMARMRFKQGDKATGITVFSQEYENKQVFFFRGYYQEAFPNERKLVKRFVLGHFLLNYGQGLVHMINQPSLYGQRLSNISGVSENRGLAGYQGAAHSGFYQGLAADFKTTSKGVSTVAFSINRNPLRIADSIFNYRLNPDIGDVFLMRAPTQVLQTPGSMISVNHIERVHGLQIGAGHTTYVFGRGIQPAATDEASGFGSSQRIFHYRNLFWQNDSGRVLHFGEVAQTNQGAWAANAGAYFIAKENLKFTLRGRYSSSDYFSIYGNAPSTAFSARGDKGLGVAVEKNLPKGITAAINLDYADNHTQQPKYWFLAQMQQIVRYYEWRLRLMASEKISLPQQLDPTQRLLIDFAIKATAQPFKPALRGIAGSINGQPAYYFYAELERRYRYFYAATRAGNYYTTGNQDLYLPLREVRFSAMNRQLAKGTGIFYNTFAGIKLLRHWVLELNYYHETSNLATGPYQSLTLQLLYKDY